MVSTRPFVQIGEINQLSGNQAWWSRTLMGNYVLSELLGVSFLLQTVYNFQMALDIIVFDSNSSKQNGYKNPSHPLIGVPLQISEPFIQVSNVLFYCLLISKKGIVKSLR